MTRHQSSDTDDTRSRLVRHSLQEFLRNGIRKVKMDDVASTLGISKRTIYEMFADKEHLVLECMRMASDEIRKTIEDEVKKSKTPVECYVRANTIMVRASKAVCPQFMDDLLRYPSVVEYFKKDRENNLHNNRLFIEECIAAGYFRPDVNYEMLLELDEEMHEVLRQSGFFRRYSLSSIIETLSDTHFRGMCTQKGMKEMNRCLRLLNKEAEEAGL